MATSFPNIYHHRRVAETAAKACDICYKPSASVMITPDKKDFFYVCLSHINDRNFCSPRVDEDAVKAKREKELEEEKERLKKEYEERQRKKKEKEEKRDKDKEKDKDKKKDKDKDKKDDEKKDDKSDAKEKEEKEDAPEPEPRIFELKPGFYQQRLTKKRQAEAAKRDRERMMKPGYFPSVPTEDPR